MYIVNIETYDSSIFDTDQKSIQLLGVATDKEEALKIASLHTKLSEKEVKKLLKKKSILITDPDDISMQEFIVIKKILVNTLIETK